MKLKIEKKYKLDIKELRRDIKVAQNKHDRWIADLAKKMGIKKQSMEYNILWDYIMNDSFWMIEFVK
jgi:hypothetical protein